MTGRTCQLCGKPLSRFTVGSGGDFCSREHRNQFRLRLGMDRLSEANKVASLMRRRENTKAIPAAQLAHDCKIPPHSFPYFNVPARPPAVRSLGSRTAALGQTRISSISRSKLIPHASPSRMHASARPLESADSFTGLKTRPLLPPRAHRFPVRIPQAGVASTRFADAHAAERRREAGMLGWHVDRTNIGGDGIQVRALPHSAVRSYQEPQPARGLTNPADRGRELRISGGVGFRLPAKRIRSVLFAGSPTSPLPNSTRPRSMTAASRPTVAGVRAATIQISVRGLFGPKPPAKNGAIEFRWPSAIVTGSSLTRDAAGASRTCDIVWKAAARPLRPRLKSGAFHFHSSAPPGPRSSTPAPCGIKPVHRLTLVRFEPRETPFECSPTALHGTLVSGMQFASPAGRKSDSAPASIEERFDCGLHNWLGGTDDWKLDVAGVRAGSLALFTPSIELADYQLEFLARLDNRSVSWVFRASNFNDYYQATLAVAPAGGYEFRRRAVIGGVPETATGCPVPTTSTVPAARTAVTLRTRVAGNEFSVLLDGQVIDTWTDSRLTTGGIGFVGAPDDRARLYWVKVTPSGHLNKEYSKP